MSHQPTFFSFSRLTVEANGSARPLTEAGSGSEKRASSSSCTSKAVVSSVLFSLAACSAFCLGAATKVHGFNRSFTKLYSYDAHQIHIVAVTLQHQCSGGIWKEASQRGLLSDEPCQPDSARPTWPQNIPQGPTALAPPAHELSQVWCAIQLQQARQDAQQDLTVGKGSVGLIWGNPKTLPQCLLHCASKPFS